MIIDKQLPPEDLTPTDPPPSYDSYDRLSIPNSQDNKYNLVDHPVASGSHSPLHSPSALSPKTPTSATGSINKGKGRAGVNWFRFNSAETRTAREVRNTVLGLVRDLIQEHNIAAAAGILQSCSDACASRDLSLSSILQEKSIENHTPLYWAIVKRPPDEHHEVEDTQGVDLLTALISYATPLNQQTIAEIRLACLVTSDQALFQRLRLSPEFAPVSKVDQMLLGATIPPEDVELEDMAGEGGGAFAVNFVIPQFHKRMVVSKEIALEFIARSRLWKLMFFVAPEPRASGDPRVGSWCLSLSLLESSPPTYLQARLIIIEAKPITLLESTPYPPPSNPTPSVSPFWLVSGRNPNPNSNLAKFVDLSTNQEQLEAGTGRRNPGRSVVVCLDDSVVGPNFQYGNNPYIGADEKLRVRLEARLGKKTNNDCIIC